jgi:hypothetical protein
MNKYAQIYLESLNNKKAALGFPGFDNQQNAIESTKKVISAEKMSPIVAAISGLLPGVGPALHGAATSGLDQGLRSGVSSAGNAIAGTGLGALLAAILTKGKGEAALMKNVLGGGAAGGLGFSALSSGAEALQQNRKLDLEQAKILGLPGSK